MLVQGLSGRVWKEDRVRSGWLHTVQSESAAWVWIVHVFTNTSEVCGLISVTLVWTAPHPQVPNGARVSGLSLNRKDSLLLANCHDRTIRMFELQPAPQGVEGVDEAHVATVLQSTGKV